VYFGVSRGDITGHETGVWATFECIVSVVMLELISLREYPRSSSSGVGILEWAMCNDTYVPLSCLDFDILIESIIV
jgi:hypothetical protein